ncbi:MAG TPA: hypothetical protein VJT32_02955, partial [bacterium]|nr:hypothetical protein [bacterium]
SVRFAILNAGREDHAFTVQGMGVMAQIAALPPQGTGSLDVTFTKPGTYRLLGGRPGTDSPASRLTVRP